MTMIHIADEPTKITPKKTWLQWKYLRFGIPVILLILGPGGQGQNLLNLVAPDRSAANVVTQQVTRKTVPISISANGIINADRSINLSPKTAGAIKTLLVKEGDRVSSRQVIATMDDSNLRGQIIQFQGQLAQQEANLKRLQAGNRPEDIAKAQAQLTEAQANLQLLKAGNRPEDIAKAAAQLAEAKSNLQQLQAGNRPQEIAQTAARLQQARATLKQRESDWQRYQELYKSGAISQQTLEQKRADRDVSQSQVVDAQQALSLQSAGTRPELIAQAKAKVEQQAQALAALKAGNRLEQITQAQAKVEQQVQTLAALKAGNRSEDIAQARAQVQAAQGALQNIQSQLTDTKVTAPFDGVVLKKYADIGSFVSPSMMSGGTGGSSLSSSILLVASDRLQVVVNLSEAQIAQVKLGQTVTIKADAVPGEKFTGKVEQIAPQATVSQNVTSFEVRVSVDAAGSAALRVGMNVDAEFAVGELANALFLPNASIVRQATGTGVYVLGDNKKPVWRAIQTGKTVGGQTEVKSGLQGNESVLLSPPAKPTAAPGGFALPKPPS
jgi:HlyD family secretion protein